MNLWRESYLHIRSYSSDFWVVLSATLMNQIGNMAMVFLLIYLTQNLNLSLTKASFAFAAFSAATIIIGLMGGGLIDKFGGARTMIASLIANGLVLLIFPFIHQYFAVILMCILWGFSYGLYRPASQTFVSELSTPGLHRLTFSIYRLVVNLGMSIGPAIGGYLASHSFAIIFIVNGIANLLASAMLILGLLHSSWLKRRTGAQKKIELSFKLLRQDRALSLFVIAMIPVSMIFFQHESTLAVFLNDLHFPLSFYGLLFTLNTLIIVFFELPLNIATMNWPYRINFMLGSVFITFSFASLVFVSKEWHVVLLAIFWTLGEMILYPSSSSYVADIAPESQRGNYMALYSTCSNLGMLLGPWAGAIIMQQLGANGLWIACGFWGILSIVLFNYVKKPNHS